MITTKNNNHKNDSKYARHRSVWKGQTNVLDNVLTELKAAQGVHHKRYLGTPKEVRDMWKADFGKGHWLPDWYKTMDPSKFTGTSGVDTWLGARSPFTDDVKVIWADFARIFARRSCPGGFDADGNRIDAYAGRTNELLFVSRNKTDFDLIYSKWGYTKGKHWFFHWNSRVPDAASRAAIDAANDDEDGEGVDND